MKFIHDANKHAPTTMTPINMRALDLNLLRMLVALARTGTVSAAADEIGLSQPAASNALGRLREAMGDPLFVRSKKGMIPTPYAQAILPGVQRHMEGLFDTLGNRSSFDPESSTRAFNLSLSGLGELVFLPRLAETVFAKAPNTKLLNASVPVDQLVDALETGVIDCAIGIIDIQARGLATTPLFLDSFVAVCGTAFPRTLTTVADLRREKLAISAPAVSYASDMARLLERHGLEDCVTLQLANFGALPSLVNALPVVAIVPSQFGYQMSAQDKVRILPIDLSKTGSLAKLIWHRRTDTDDACTWLRGCIIDQFADPDVHSGDKTEL